MICSDSFVFYFCFGIFGSLMVPPIPIPSVNVKFASRGKTNIENNCVLIFFVIFVKNEKLY